MGTENNSIVTNNKLIAEFMGMVNSAPDFWADAETGAGRILGEYTPHEDWNVLIRVVEKIEAIEDSHHGRFAVYISSNSCTIQATNLRTDKPMANPPHLFLDMYGKNKIEAVWITVLQFIRWHNSTAQ